MEIFERKTPFKLAIDNIASKKTFLNENRKNLTNIVGCALRHFYIFDCLISQLQKDFSLEQKVALNLFLANHLFVTVIEDKEIREQLEKYRIDLKDVEKLKELSTDKSKLIPEKYTNDSIEYLHFRYNIPEWVLKMWMKHFKGYTYKIVRTINRPSNHYSIINKSLITKEELENKYPEFKKTTFDGLYLYEGNIAPKRHPLYKEGKVVSISPAEFYLLSKLDLDVIRNIALYSECYNTLHLQLMSLLSNRYQMDVISGASESFFSVKKDIETYKLNNVRIYETGHSSIITCLSNKVGNFFVMPKSSNFAEFRKSPDYFNRLNQDDLDDFIANQSASLLSAADFVEDNGNLIYIVPTMDKKESVQISEEFLKNRKDFVLVEQKQFLPFDKYDSTLFIAIFRKEVRND